MFYLIYSTIDILHSIFLFSFFTEYFSSRFFLSSIFFYISNIFIFLLFFFFVICWVFSKWAFLILYQLDFKMPWLWVRLLGDYYYLSVRIFFIDSSYYLLFTDALACTVAGNFTIYLQVEWTMFFLLHLVFYLTLYRYTCSTLLTLSYGRNVKLTCLFLVPTTH